MFSTCCDVSTLEQRAAERACSELLEYRWNTTLVNMGVSRS